MSKFAFLLVAIIIAVASAFQPNVNHMTSIKSRPAFATPNRNVIIPSIVSSLAMSDVSEEEARKKAEAEEFGGMFWNDEYPPSKVLGPIMSKMPSNMLGVLAILAAGACFASIGGSQELIRNDPSSIATGSWIKWYYVLGSFMGPFAWGFHVACWIQRKNGL